MNDNVDSNAWVFDSLVGFLHGPVWNVPLQTFIEEKSLPFEPTDDGEVPDKEEYKKVHNEYRNLVDLMLGSFMDDIGITAEQFQEACNLSAQNLAGLPPQFYRRLFEQIWAANDYNVFVKMMTHKNVELQLQALELIETRFGTLPSIFSSESEDYDSLRSDDPNDDLRVNNDADDVMTEIKKLHLEDDEIAEVSVNVQPDEVEEEKQNLLWKLQNFDKTEHKGHASVTKKNQLLDEQAKPAYLKATKKEVSEEEIRVRQEYLKQQRDKLLALKKQVREKQLGAAESELNSGGGEFSNSASRRPRSAKMAHAALTGATPVPPPDAMQLRKALASKLKAKVVDST